jgi:DNA recombination protein RmuC
MPPAAVIALAVAAAVLAALLVALLLRRLAAPRATAERIDLERRLAAAEQRCTLIPELEGALQAREVAIALLRDEKSAAERAQAGSAEAIRGLTATNSELRERLATTETEVATARARTSELAAQFATAAEAIEQERRAAAEKIALLSEAREAMRTEFKLLAEEAMQRQGEVFGRQNREQIDTILGPMREKLVEFQQGLQAAHGESTRERATLAEQIRQLSDHSARMTTETLNLTRALKGKAQTQGAWGEMVLASILERSGLREGEEYVAQKSHAGEDGQRLRPDVVVNLPGGQKMVIDAKVSLVAFEAHVNAETDAERAAHLALHLTSLRTHIRGLSEKSYAAAVGSRLDYVIMFVPIEGALAAALGADPELTGLAAERNVTIATPTTLMMALRTVANVWNVEKRHRNAEEIARRAGQLYDKFVGFAEDMGRLGKAIDGARSVYGDAIGKLSTGKGNLVRQVEQLRELGARTGKSLPAALLDDGAELALANEAATPLGPQP